MWNVQGFTFGIGWLLALLVLIAVFVIWLAGEALDREVVLALFAGLALARLLP
jgi:hypothetical protein